MKSLRLVLITRRFWPLAGGAERNLAHLATEMAARGCSLTLLTARWDPHWPGEIRFGRVPVIRLAPPQAGWAALRSMWSLAAWLRAHRHEFDLAYVSMLRHEAYATLWAVGRSLPVVLRAEEAGTLGDCRWQRVERCGKAIARRCRRAAAIVAPCPVIRDELLEHGYPADSVRCLPNGVRLPAERSATERAAARRALADANPGLFLPPNTPLAVTVCPLHTSQGLIELITAWRPIVARHPLAKLWLAGDGPHRLEIENQIRAQHLSGSVSLVGTFDALDDLFAAADVCVLPALEGGTPLSLVEAMAAGVPIVASDIAAHRACPGLLVAPQDRAALIAAIAAVLDHPDLGMRLGAAGRQRAASEFPLETMVDRHLELFQSLVPSTTVVPT